MKKSEIRIGGYYEASVNGRVTVVRVDRIVDRSGWDKRSTTSYYVTNTATKRETVFRSAMKFRGPAEKPTTAKPIPADSPIWGLASNPLADAVKQAATEHNVALEADPRDRVDPLDRTEPEDVPATDHDLDLHNATKKETPAVPKINDRLAARKTAASAEPPHIVVEALAGTGKTTTLIEGLKVMRGLPTRITPSPQQKAVWDTLGESKDARTVCFVAFNKSIAKELADRVPPGCEAKTMHGLGFGAVRKAFGNVQVNEYKVQDILLDLLGIGPRPEKPVKPTQQQEFEYKARVDSWFNQKQEKAIVLNAAGKLVDLARLNLTDLDEPGALADLAAYYDVDLTADEDEGGADYSAEVFDLVPKALDRCKIDMRHSIDYTDMVWGPIVHNLPVFKFDLLLVDEAQDLSPVTQALAKKAGKRLVLVGDKNQSVYGFAGADCDSIPRMIRELGETSRGVKCLPLTVTRRCGRAIVEEARKLVPTFEAHPDNPAGQINFSTMEPLKTDPPTPGYQDMVREGDMVLCRCNAPLVAEAFGFIKRGIKANIQGRDIGQGLVSLVKKMKVDTVPDLILKLEHWREREEAKELAKKNPSDSRLTAIRDKAECLVIFTDGCETTDDVVRKIEAVFTDDKTKPGIKLSSIHKAKGTESSRVFLLQPKGSEVVPEWLKLGWEIAQSKNLLYVAQTRAISELVYVS